MNIATTTLRIVLWSVWLFSAGSVVEAARSPQDDLVTFLVFDNGATVGGVQVTLSAHEFSTITATAGESSLSYSANELFAMHLSRLEHVRVSKFGQEPGTVVATKAFREDGETITRFDQLREAWGVIRYVYLVADGLQFVWPFIEPGHKQLVSRNVIPPIPPSYRQIVLESLSETPRVFKVHNLFSTAESEALIENAMNLTGDKALARSTVGNRADSGKGEEASDRTSDNAWDHSTPTAKSVISRSFNLTRIVEDAGQIDGLQVVRYQPGQGYNTHPDFFQSSDVTKDFNFLPYEGGSNRFATVFMYLSDVEEGGSTVFPYTPPLAEPKPIPDASLDMLKENTWEYNLNKECHTKLSVEPKIGTAALFYSVRPDGQIDKKSYHGACPVIKGLKWGANIWIWNKQRYGATKTGGEPRTLTVRNLQLDETAYLSWEGHPMGDLPPGYEKKMNTFEYHRFQAHLGSHENKEIFDEFTVQSQPESQVWSIQPPRKLLSSQQQHAVEAKEEEENHNDNDAEAAAENNNNNNNNAKEEEKKENNDDDNNTNNNNTNAPTGGPQRTLLITNNKIRDNVYIMWQGKEGTILAPGGSIEVHTFVSHQFEAKLHSFESLVVISRYVVEESTRRQLWAVDWPSDAATQRDEQGVRYALAHEL